MQMRNPFAGIKFLFVKQTQTFPTGLIRLVEEVLIQDDIEYQIIDLRSPVPLGPELPLFGDTFRDYQDEAVSRAVSRQRGIIKIATGGGKTNVIAGIISKTNVRTLILTHKVDLLHQLRKSLVRNLQQPVGIIGDGQCEIEKFTVATIQTLAAVYANPKKKSKTKKKRKTVDTSDAEDTDFVLPKKDQICNFIDAAQAIITDECHHVPSESFWDIHRRAKNAYYKIGLSASPWREDNADMLIEAAHARQLIDVPASLLIQRGYLTPPIVYLYKFRHAKKGRAGTKYPIIYDEEVVNHDERNQAIVQLALQAASAGKTVLIAVSKIEHGKLLETMLQMVEPNALFVYGDSDSDERQTVLKELNERRRQIVICTTIFGEGVDVPNLDVLINAKAAASSVDAFQLIGRVLRKTNQKSMAYAIDIFDESCKFLSAHSNARLRIYQTEPKYTIKPITNLNQISFNDEEVKQWLS